MNNETARGYTSPEDTMVWHHASTPSLPFHNIPHNNLHWTFCNDGQCEHHKEQKNGKTYKSPGENGYPTDHCYCGEQHPAELDEVIRTRRLNPRKACRRCQQGRRICQQCGFFVNLTEHSLRCNNRDTLLFSPANNTSQLATSANDRPASPKELEHLHPRTNDLPQRVQREQTAAAPSLSQPTTVHNPLSTWGPRNSLHPRYPTA
jgi:hypothetical protein